MNAPPNSTTKTVLLSRSSCVIRMHSRRCKSFSMPPGHNPPSFSGSDQFWHLLNWQAICLGLAKSSLEGFPKLLQGYPKVFSGCLLVGADFGFGFAKIASDVVCQDLKCLDLDVQGCVSKTHLNLSWPSQAAANPAQV